MCCLVRSQLCRRTDFTRHVVQQKRSRLKLDGCVYAAFDRKAQTWLMASLSYLVCQTCGAGTWWVCSSSPPLQPGWRCRTAGRWCTGCPAGRPLLSSDSSGSSAPWGPVTTHKHSDGEAVSGRICRRGRTPENERITETEIWAALRVCAREALRLRQKRRQAEETVSNRFDFSSFPVTHTIWPPF